MSYEKINCTVADQLLTIELNRAEKMNAVTQQIREELVSAFGEADNMEDFRDGGGQITLKMFESTKRLSKRFY